MKFNFEIENLRNWEWRERR